MRRWIVFLVALLVASGLPACGSDDGDGNGNGGGGDGDLQGVRFTRPDAPELAGRVVTVFDFFAGLNGVYVLLIEAVETFTFPPGEPMPAEGYDLGDPGFCPGGTTTAKWKDGDDSRTLTAGDVVTVEVEDCDGEISGTLALHFTEVAFALTRAWITYDLVSEETVDGSLEIGTMTAEYQLEVNRVDIPEPGFIIAHQVPDQTDGGKGLLLTLNGETATEMGCFRLYYVMNLESGLTVLSEPYAVFKVPDHGVMTMESWGLQAFEFPDGGEPVKGVTTLKAMSGSTPCSSLGIPGGGVDSNGSFLDITVMSGGTVLLSGETESGTPFTMSTTWEGLN